MHGSKHASSCMHGSKHASSCMHGSNPSHFDIHKIYDSDDGPPNAGLYVNAKAA
jgi:hypothetical protein